MSRFETVDELETEMLVLALVSELSPIMDELCERVPTEELDGLLQRSLQEQYEEIELQFDNSFNNRRYIGAPIESNEAIMSRNLGHSKTVRGTRALPYSHQIIIR